MKKASSSAAGKVREIEPFDKRSIDLRKFKPDLSVNDVQKALGPVGSKVIFPFLAIETLSPTKTVGRGRTNLTIVAPNVVQTDATVPRATFDKRLQARRPAIQMHFEPIAYGITSVGNYVMEFTIEALGQSNFNLVGSGNVQNAGAKVLNGPAKVSLIFKNVLPTDQNFGFLEQTAGGVWHWFSVQLRFPDLVITL
jgi:hypothetical protein